MEKKYVIQLTKKDLLKLFVGVLVGILSGINMAFLENLEVLVIYPFMVSAMWYGYLLKEAEEK